MIWTWLTRLFRRRTHTTWSHTIDGTTHLAVFVQAEAPVTKVTYKGVEMKEERP